MSIITINPAKGFKIEFPKPNSEFTISTTSPDSSDSSDPTVPIRITVSFDGPVPFKFILVNGRRIICDPKDNKVFIYEVEQCPISSESTGCSICDFPYDERGMCPSCGDKTVMELKIRGLGPFQPPHCLPKEWRIQEDGCSAQSKSVEYCETCCCFHCRNDGCSEY